MLTDGDVPEQVKGQLAADMIFTPEQHIPLTRRVGRFISWFHNGGADVRREDAENADDTFLSSRLPYRFDVDYPYIQAAFLEQYGIDLNATEYMHWWTFRNLFRALHDCKFTEIVGYRTADTGEMSDGMKKHYKEMQEIYELPVSITERLKIKQARAFLERG